MSSPLPPSPDPFAEAWRPGTSYALVLRFAPEESRSVLAFLFALKLQLDRLLEAGAESGVMRVKALWWEEELERAARGEARHPLTRKAQSLGLLDVSGCENLRLFAAGYAPFVGASPRSADDLVERARMSGGTLLERVACVLGERRPEGRQTARCAGTAHETLALLLHDRATRERFPEDGDERRTLLVRIRTEIEDLAETAGSLWSGEEQRATRILTALTRARLEHGEPGLLRKTLLAWWNARHEHVL
jgi:hypothetical protein